MDSNETKMPLPVGRTEFVEWSTRIIEKAGKFADVDSMTYALASQLIHLPHDVAYKEDSYFINSLRKAAANQVASAFFQEIKTKQLELAKAAELANKAEATAPPETAVTSDEQKD